MAVRSATLLHFIGCLGHLDAAWTIRFEKTNKRPVDRCFEWDISQSPLRLTISFIPIICGMPCEKPIYRSKLFGERGTTFCRSRRGLRVHAYVFRFSALTFDFIQLYGFTCSYPHALVHRQSTFDMMMRCDLGHRWNTTYPSEFQQIFNSFYVWFADENQK